MQLFYDTLPLCRLVESLDVAVVVDVLFTVAIISLATGAVTELKFRIADVGSATDGAAVGIGRFHRCLCGFVRTGVELDDLCLLLGLFPEQSPGVDSPTHGNYVQNVFSEEQEIVCQGNHGEQIVGEGKGKQIHQNNGKVQQCKNPCFHGNDEEQQKLCVGKQRCVAEEQTEIQIGNIGLPTKDQTVNIHHQNARQIEQVEPKGSPDIFHSLSQGIVAEQGDGHQQQIIDPVSQRIGDQTPDLSLQDQIPVEAQQVIQGIVSHHLAHHIYHSGAQDDVQHQIGNAFVFILETE